MKNNLKEYRSILKENDFKEYSYQKKFITNGEFLSSKKPFVLAMGTSAGKTITTIMFLEIFYRNKRNKNKKTLIIPSSVKILRDNFENVLTKFKPTFRYKVAKNSKELIKYIIEDDYDVLICLPMSLHYQLRKLPKFDNFILDEAHQWYFKDTIGLIIKKIKPKHQLLLSGTPSKFIQNGDKFNFQFVPIMELYDEGIITNAKIEIVSANYNVKNSDFISMYGNLKNNKNLNNNQSKSALEYLCNLMLTKIKKRPKSKFDVFNYLPKTIIFCHSIKQSKYFYKILNTNLNTKGRILISNQIDDLGSENFKIFNNDKKKKVMICVNRGRLGFSMNQLFNVVDFTLTKNIDVMLQIFGRLLRLSKHKLEEKTYYKISPHKDVFFYENIMNAMLCLTQYEWYTKFNGLNMGGIRIPLIRNPYQINQKTKVISKIQREIREFDREKFGIPIDLNFFKKIDDINKKSKFNSVSYTSLDDIKKVLYPTKRSRLPIDEIKKNALKYKTKTDFLKNDPKSFYDAKRYNIFNEVCSHMIQLRKVYDLKMLKSISNKYSSLKDFYKNEPNAYSVANRMKVLPIITSHMLRKRTNIKFTKSKVAELAKKCIGRKEFNIKYSSESKWAKKNGYYDEITKHMINRLGLSKQTLINISKKYINIMDLKKSDPIAYKMIIDRNLKPYLKFKKK